MSGFTEVLTRNCGRVTAGTAVFPAILCTLFFGAASYAPAAKGASPTSEQNFGETSDLAGKWWNWAMTGPPEENPLTDPDGRNCALGQRGTIWFLAGSFGGQLGEPNPVTRSCTIPAGMRILVPIYVSVYWFPEDGATLRAIRAIANSSVADPGLQLVLDLRLDGKLIIDPYAYRAQSPPGGFSFRIPEGSATNVLFGFPAGLRKPAVADGYWVLLNQLEPGSHTIRIRASLSTGFSMDVRYELTVL